MKDIWKDQPGTISTPTFALAAVVTSGVNLAILWLLFLEWRLDIAPTVHPAYYALAGIDLAVVIWLAIKRKTGLVAGILAGLLATPVLIVAFFVIVILPAMRVY